MSTQEQKYLHELHFENANFKKSLKFFQDELVTFNNRLEEIAKANTKIEVLSEVEKYQNQFIRQNEVIDEILSALSKYEHRLFLEADKNNVATDHRKTEDHVSLRNEFTVFEKIYSEMKMNYTEFLSEVY